jgi:hypothetical protein
VAISYLQLRCTPAILILVLSVVLLVLFCTHSLAVVVEALPRSCLAKILSADHTEYTFHSCSVLLYPRVYWSDTQHWVSFTVACCIHYPSPAVYQESLSSGTCFLSRCLAVRQCFKILTKTIPPDGIILSTL